MRVRTLCAPLSPPRWGLCYLLDSQGTPVLVPLDQRDRRLRLHGAADVPVDPDGNVDDGGHVHHTGRIWEGSSTVLAQGESPSLLPAWLQRICLAFVMNSKPSTTLAPTGC